MNEMRATMGGTYLVAHFRYFVSERRVGAFDPQIVGMSILISKKKRFVDSGHRIIRRDAF